METKMEVPVLEMDIKMLIDMLDNVVIENTINNNNDKIRADNIETTEMVIDKEITTQIHTTMGETVTTTDTNDINNITRIEDQTILDNQITTETIKELDTTTMTIPTLMIDTNNNTDHTDIVQIEEEIMQTQPIEAITQEEIMAGIPAMDIDTNSTSLIELGGGGDVKMGTKGDVESYEGEEILADNSQEINIDLQNYIQENNKNKEKYKKDGGVNETKLNSNKGKYIYRDWKDIKIRNNSVDDIHSLGSQLLICKRWIDIRTINYKEFMGYAQSIDIVLKGKENSIRLINVYLICNDKKKKTAITETVDKWIDEAQILNLNLIVMGDFNERKVNQDNASKDTMFLDILEEYNLIDIHTKFNNEEALATWSNGMISTTIDFIYMSYKLINKVEIHEILNIEKVLDTDHKALTITLRIKDERTADVRKPQEIQNFMSKKFLKIEWENIANRVEENLIESPINLDTYNDNTKYWSVLRDRITMEMDKLIKEKQLQLNSKGKFQTDLSKMTTIQRLKKKIAIIGEIENTITKWRKLKGKIENDTLTYGVRRVNTSELYLINKYKSVVNRFASIDKLDEEYSSTHIDNVLDNEEKLKNIIKDLRKVKTRTTSNIKIEEIKEKDRDIERNIKTREHMITYDLKEMITRVMDNRREQIKIDSCQQILKDRIRMITDHEEVKNEVREHYKKWTGVRNFNEIAFNNNWKDEYEPLDEINDNIYMTLCEEVQLDELNGVLKQVKNDKAAGASGKRVET
ncbi:unnamed protein product [Rhizophagus irregularis]|nr:unnamed protein product [Rhizophagus irregularis]